MVIDTHVHLIRPTDSKGNPQIYSPANETSAEEYVALMDRSGIDRAFLISWSPEDIPSDLLGRGIDPDSVRETMSREYAREVMRDHSDRFVWFPCHLGPLLGDAREMVQRNLDGGAAGIKLVCSFWGELPDDERLMPLYDIADEYGANVIVDTSYWYLGKDEPADPDDLPPGHRDVARRVKSFGDYMSHVADVVTAYPRVNFQLAHAGARTFTPEHAAESGAFIARHPNVFADLGALRPDSPALDVLVDAAGAESVMFGTDWPHFAQGDTMREAIDAVRRPGRFTDDTARMILGDNARRFLGEMR